MAEVTVLLRYFCFTGMSARFHCALFIIPGCTGEELRGRAPALLQLTSPRASPRALRKSGDTESAEII